MHCDLIMTLKTGLISPVAVPMSAEDVASSDCKMRICLPFGILQRRIAHNVFAGLWRWFTGWLSGMYLAKNVPH